VERRWFATTTRPPHRRYDDVDYRAGDVVAFGCEATGLGEMFLRGFPSERRLHIPMRPSNRSLNLANAVSIVAYEAWRQRGFAGAATGSFEESLRGRLPVGRVGNLGGGRRDVPGLGEQLV